LSEAAVKTFLAKWCDGLYPESRDQAEQHREELIEALHGRPEIARMARNPVMLTALAVVHWNERRLPEQRADLYESIVTWLSRSREQRPGRQSAERCISLLQSLALGMQSYKKGRQVEVSRRWAAESISPALRELPESDRVDVAERFLADEELDSGIVVSRGPNVRFWHLTFQEYLAARAIAGRTEKEQHHILFANEHLYLPEWQEVMLLLAGVLHYQGPEKVDGFVSAVIDQLGTDAALPAQARCAGLLGAIFKDLTPFNYTPPDSRYDHILDSLSGVFDASKSVVIPLAVRVQAADALGRAGDGRLQVENWVSLEPTTINIDPTQMALNIVDDPDVQAVSESAETLSALSQPGSRSPRRIRPFAIGKYPVTVVEFSQFVKGGGYEDERWWRGCFGKWTAPRDWPDQLAYPSRPVTGVSWNEAEAYATWAGARLPSEVEWERAAGGRESRRYPWGNERPEPFLANFSMLVGHPSPVGIFPAGATREGVQDLAGNVWEWCMNPVRSSPYRVLKGGSWLQEGEALGISTRMITQPLTRADSVGFRIVRDLT
jgi:formylglycine-generating enzyme required for sulfatase activity